MRRDPLVVLRRLRHAAVTEASRELAMARVREQQAVQRLDGHHAQVRQETSEAVAGQVAAFANWLPHARQHGERLAAGVQVEEARVRRLQQILVGRKTDAEAVVKALHRRQVEAALIEGRKEQAVMDEAAGRRGRRDGGSAAG
jgi:flagellar biosynthesis chaperone FliJ